MFIEGSYIAMNITVPKACRAWIYILKPVVPPKHIVKIMNISRCVRIPIILIALTSSPCTSTSKPITTYSFTIPWSPIFENTSCIDIVINNEVVYAYKTHRDASKTLNETWTYPFILNPDILNITIEETYVMKRKSEVCIYTYLMYPGSIGIHISTLDKVPEDTLTSFGIAPKTIVYRYPNGILVVEYHFVNTIRILYYMAIEKKTKIYCTKADLDGVNTIMIKVFVDGTLKGFKEVEVWT